MSVDRLLTTVLRLYQDVHDDARTDQIYGSTAALLTNLSNPLNLSLLTSQLLTAPAIWGRGDGMRACFRIISIYNTASIHVRRNEIENSKNLKAQNKKNQGSGWSWLGGWGQHEKLQQQQQELEQQQQPHKQRAGGGLRSDAWAAAVLKGADDQSGRWQHLLVFTGVLMGMEGADRHSLSPAMRATVERAVVTAANLALQNRDPEPPAPSGPVALALNYAFPLLSDDARARLNCDALVALAARAMLGPDGLQDGLLLATIDQDVRQSEHKFMWDKSSPSFLHLHQLEQRPLISGLGPLSRLLAHAVEHARDHRIVLQLQDDLVAFTGRLLQHWQANKLCELDISEEAVFLTPETVNATLPALWQFLKKVMYAVVAVLHAVVARSLLDPHLKNHAIAPAVASKTLHTLRNLYFISSRNGSDAFQVYTFTYLTSLDVLSRYGPASAAFLRSILPSPSPPTPSPDLTLSLSLASSPIPAHPLRRTLDLFYLNTAEHLPLHLSPADCDALIIQPATTYLSTPTTSNPQESAYPLSARMIHLFEAAHAAVLSCLSCAHNAPLTADLVPFYADALLSAFPAHVSPRQFRLAFRTVVQILSPPFPISASHPLLAETLLEMVRYRVRGAGRGVLPPPPGDGEGDAAAAGGEGVASEQSTLVMTLIDALPYLRLGIFEEWMGLVAGAVNEVGEEGGVLREGVRRRFWEVLVSGEMDVERAAIAVAWWGTKGGREMVLFGGGRLAQQQPPQEMFMMSGALQETGRESRL